jgi:hypothetical protein
MPLLSFRYERSDWEILKTYRFTRSDVKDFSP